MSSNDTWMPLYLGDYLADTGHLSTAEHGAYLLLLMHYWRNGPLADDQSALMRIARAQSAEWRKIKVNVLAFFTVGDDGLLHQKRMDQERSKCGVISEKRREAGRAGAQAKWRPNGEHSPPDPREGMANANGKCHPVAIDLPSGLPETCHRFATDFAIPPVPINQYKLESKKEREGEDSLTLSFASPSACARKNAPNSSPETTAEPMAHPLEVANTVAKVVARRRHIEYGSAWQPDVQHYREAARSYFRPSLKPQPLVGDALVAFRRAAGMIP